MINYHNKKFRVSVNTENGEISSETVFHYQQTGNILTGEYSGENIVKGQLIGKVNDRGEIDMRYHHINTRGEFMTGICKSIPEILNNGKIKLHESWQWTSGDQSKGKSILVEE